MSSCLNPRWAIFLIGMTFLVSISSCTYKGTFEAVETNNTFEISFPDYMTKADDLKPDAALQYSNPYRNLYTIIEKSEKNGQSFEEYQSEALNILRNYDLLENTLVTDSIYTEPEFGRQISIELYGIMQEENIYYWHNTYETDKYFYQVVTWTRSMDRKMRYGPDIEKIVASFKPTE